MPVVRVSALWFMAVILLGTAFAQSNLTGTATYSGTAIYQSGPGIIPATLFGLHFRFNNDPRNPVVQVQWPGVPFGSLRLWDTETRWQNQNPSNGVYDFTSLDHYLSSAKFYGLADILLTLSATPSWAAAVPTQSGCDYQFFALGDCSPPADLNSDGTGPNQHWRDYIYHLGTHVAGLNPSGYATVNYFEMWNEFSRGAGSSPTSWLGTDAQLVRMAQDANCILTGRGTITATSQACNPSGMVEPAVGVMPLAHVTTPDSVPQLPDVTVYGNYLSTTGALNSVDILAVHAYAFQGLGTTSPDGGGGATALNTQWSGIQAVLPGAAFGLPIWSTEGSWGPGLVNLPDNNMEEGYVARYYMMGWSSGFRRLYWYSYANSWGRLAYQNGDSTCFDSTGRGCLQLSATGWDAVYAWMVGNEMTSGCAPDSSGNIWTCGFLIGGSSPALAVWDSSQACGVPTPNVTPCTYSTYPYPVTYHHYKTLDGATTLFPLTGGTQQIGWKPILLVP